MSEVLEAKPTVRFVQEFTVSDKIKLTHSMEWLKIKQDYSARLNRGYKVVEELREQLSDYDFASLLTVIQSSINQS